MSEIQQRSQHVRTPPGGIEGVKGSVEPIIRDIPDMVQTPTSLQEFEDNDIPRIKVEAVIAEPVKEHLKVNPEGSLNQSSEEVKPESIDQGDDHSQITKPAIKTNDITSEAKHSETSKNKSDEFVKPSLDNFGQKQSPNASPVCRNCKTQTTPLWRRDETGQVLCNACGLFLKLHGRPRPISLKTDTIKLRNRIKSTPGSKATTSPNTPELKSKEKSPKTKKKGELTPLLPAARSLQQTKSAQPTPATYIPHLPHHIQPLHYPSSTPTQFAPSLQRITSPLLLSTTSSVRGAPIGKVSSESASAASALETMFNDLGPSASFRLKDDISITRRSEFSTPSSALNNGSPPKLPALSGTRFSVILGPPAVQQDASQDQQEPSSNQQNQLNQQNQQNQQPQKNQPTQQNQSTQQNNNQQQQPSQPPPSQPGQNPHELTFLRTRISELELVNDLYRTRIMELEAMEQAARLRETSTRKRLDDVLSQIQESDEQEKFSGPPALPHMFNGQLPPPVLHKSGNLLPIIGGGGVVLPTLKRDYTGEYDEDKRQRLQ